jgi:hypothetical protein
MKAEYNLAKMKSRENPFAAQLKQQSVYSEENESAEESSCYKNKFLKKSNKFQLKN